MASTRSPILVLALACAFGFAAPFLAHAPQARAGDDDKELKKARRALKKNYKKLLKMSAALDDLKEKLRITSFKEPEKRDKIGQEIDQVRTLCMQQVEKVREADDEKAAEALCEFAIQVQDEDVYQRTRDEMLKFEQGETIDWLVEQLKEGSKEPKRGRGDEDAWKRQVMAAHILAPFEGEDIDKAYAAVVEKGTNPDVVNAVVAEAKRRGPPVIPALIELLGRVEKQGGWEYFNVRQALTDLTGQDFFTKEKWKNWWGSHETGWDPKQKGETKEAATRERGPQEQVPTFFGSKIESNRLVFVIDSSGSMTMTDKPKDSDMSPEDFRAANPDEEPIKSFARIERAKRETVKAIEALLPTQTFDIIDFDSKVREWQPDLVPATPQNKQAAIEWVKGSIKDEGGTYTDKALERAFAFPQVDTIYLLSDGAPFDKVGNPAPRDQWPKDASGKVDENQPVAGDQQVQFATEMIDKILDYVRFQTRFHKVKINTFGMDGPGVWHKKWTQPRPVTLPTDARWLSTLSNFMRQLASITGGEYKSI